MRFDPGVIRCPVTLKISTAKFVDFGDFRKGWFVQNEAMNCAIFRHFIFTSSLLILDTLAQNRDCPGPQRTASFETMSEFHCAIKCADSATCSSYTFDPSYVNLDSKLAPGTCELMSKYVDNFLVEDIGVPQNAKQKLRLNVEGNQVVFSQKPKGYSASQVAASKGFSDPLNVPSQNVTRYLRLQAGTKHYLQAYTTTHLCGRRFESSACCSGRGR